MWGQAKILICGKDNQMNFTNTWKKEFEFNSKLERFRG